MHMSRLKCQNGKWNLHHECVRHKVWAAAPLERNISLEKYGGHHVPHALYGEEIWLSRAKES
ncbi:hypothetical protein LR48_Vigan11g065000 [Vigna angularis]|uniref:Uncharacterized protein n=1 Tax=Phaseolus angularis TaxID=3914 RepID=A0A0L9VRX4_PHAAN|nr:hypothetical protein LR48_Vigan11g065000 [Vigna angularis]